MGTILITVDGRPALTTHQLAAEFGLDPSGARTAFRRVGIRPIEQLDGRTPLYDAAASRALLAGRPGRGGSAGRHLVRRAARHGASAAVDSGQARAWLAEHNGQVLRLAAILVDHRDELADLVDGPARTELLLNIDGAGELMDSPRASTDLAGAVAMAVHLLRPEAARPVQDREVAAALAQGRDLFWAS
jgi:hypothetical protein